MSKELVKPVKKEKPKQNKVTKTTPSKKRSTFTTFISLVVIGFSIFMVFGVVKEVITTIELKKELAVAQEQLDSLNLENEYLVNQRDKLSDPEYVKSYARGSYMLSKEGEQIFHLPSKSETPATSSSSPAPSVAPSETPKTE